MRGITTEMITLGLERLKERADEWPPNALMFRALCEGRSTDQNGNDTSHFHKSAAYRQYRPGEVLEDHGAKERSKTAHKIAMEEIRVLFGSSK